MLCMMQSDLPFFRPQVAQNPVFFIKS